LAFVKRVGTVSSKNAYLVLCEFKPTLPYKIHTVQTDNGSEFLLHFDNYLHSQNITHLFTYPHSPQINGYIERFNHTLQDEFLKVARGQSEKTISLLTNTYKNG
jgi:transposase InsO family protein